MCSTKGKEKTKRKSGSSKVSNGSQEEDVGIYVKKKGKNGV